MNFKNNRNATLFHGIFRINEKSPMETLALNEFYFLSKSKNV